MSGEGRGGAGPEHGRVVLSGLEFHGRHGVYAEEARLGARFVVDAELHYDFAGLPDQLERAVNYAAVYETVRLEVTGERYSLIEVLCDRLCARLLAEHPLLAAVTVRVHKPHAPIPGIFRDVYAELRRVRP